MANHKKAKREDHNEKNLFLSYLAEYQRKRPVVDTVFSKRERFARLNETLARAILLGNFEKSLWVAQHMRDILDNDEYKDEYVTAPVQEIYLYLDSIIMLTCYHSSRDLKKCIDVCTRLLHTAPQVYPMLYYILAGCCMKLKLRDKAAIVVNSGLEFVLGHYYSIEKLRQELRCEHTFFTVRDFGDNAVSFVLLVLYALGKVLNLQVDEKVRAFSKEHHLDLELKMIRVRIKTRHGCCFGNQVNEALSCLSIDISKRQVPYLKPFMDEMLDDLLDIPDSKKLKVIKHVSSHCSLQPVVLNCNGMNALLDVPSFAEVPFILDTFFDCDCFHSTTLMCRCCSKKTGKVRYPIPPIPRYVKRVNQWKLAWRVGKPYGAITQPASVYERAVLRIFRKIISPLVKQISKHVRLDAEIAIMYLQVLNADNMAHMICDSMDATNMHLLSIQNQYDLETGGRIKKRAFAYIDEQLDILTRCMTEWRGFAQQGVGYVHFRNFPEECPEGSHVLRDLVSVMQNTYYAQQRAHKGHENANLNVYNVDCKRSLNARASKETQTNHSKWLSRTKQTQTDKHSPEELSLYKQINVLETALAVKTSKLDKLEETVAEHVQARKEFFDFHNKTVKGLKKELSQAKKTIFEKNKEINHQKYQIEQLQNNLSKLNKPYSHAVKPPEDVQQLVCTKAVVKENEKLQVMNANILAQNSNLHRQLDEMTKEFDKMKGRRDALAENCEEISVMYKEKCEQYDELYNKITSLNDTNREALQAEQEKYAGVKQFLLSVINDLMDLLTNKIEHYKQRCEQIHQDLSSYFYSTIPNLNVKQMCEANQLFLLSLANQLDRYTQILLLANDGLHSAEDDFQNRITAVNWKDLIVYTDEFCTALLNQYCQVLTSLMATHYSLNNALMENARLVNQSCNANTQTMMDPDKIYQSHYLQNVVADQRVTNVPLQSLPPSPCLGPIGSNRPQASMSQYGTTVRPPSPDIDDPNTKNILSQIGHAVDFPANMTLSNYGRGGVQAMPVTDPSLGVVRRPVSNFNTISHGQAFVNGTNHTNGSAGNCQSRQRQISAMKQNHTWTQSANPSSLHNSGASGSSGGDTDFSGLNGKYREIFIAVKKRFPNALMSDLISALLFLRAMNVNLNKISLENIYENVGNYIDQQMRQRLKICEPLETVPSSVATDEFCSICFERMNQMPSYTLKCLHIFHEKCIVAWMRVNNNCPICRRFTFLE